MDVQKLITILLVLVCAIIAIRYLTFRFFPELRKPKKEEDINCEETACKGCPAKESCHSSAKEV